MLPSQKWPAFIIKVFLTHRWKHASICLCFVPEELSVHFPCWIIYRVPQLYRNSSFLLPSLVLEASLFLSPQGSPELPWGSLIFLSKRRKHEVPLAAATSFSHADSVALLLCRGLQAASPMFWTQTAARLRWEYYWPASAGNPSLLSTKRPLTI